MPTNNVTVTTPPAVTVNTIPKFTGGTAIHNSTINDVAGKVGIGVAAPASNLDVNGTIRLGGTVPIPGISVNAAGNVGIGIAVPGAKLDVAGVIQLTGFKLPQGGAINKYVLTSDATGNGTWKAAVTGTPNFLPKFISTNAIGDSIGDSVISESGGNIGIGTATPGAKLDVSGTIQALLSILALNGLIGRSTNPATPAGVFDGAAGGKIISGQVVGVEKFSVDDSGNVVANGIIFPDGTSLTTGATGPVAPAGQIDLSTRVEVTTGKGLMNDELTSMCTSYSQAYIMQDGTVKTCGGPRYGNLGSGDYQNYQLRPVPLSFDNQNIGPVASVLFSFSSGHALTAAGDVWGWGYNGLGQVGDGSYTTRYFPVPLNWGAYTKPKIIKLACTTREEYTYFDHPAWYALDETGQVWAWGYGGNGQLAIGNTVTQAQPFLTSITGVVDIEATGGPQGAVFAIKSNGEVWSAGYNATGILGYAGPSNIWKKVNLPAACIKVRSTGHYHSDGYGYGHTFFLLADGQVYSSGHNGYGQLGNGTQNGVNGDPTVISSLSNIVDVWVGGGLWGCSFAVNGSGDFFVWGANYSGQLGIGTAGYEILPKPHPVKNVKSVKLGGWSNTNHSLLLTQSGEVYSAGCNDYGQLGMGVSGQPNPPYTHKLMLLPPGVQGNIVQISVSGQSNVTASQMLDNNGHVWICGNNNGYQLGANPTFNDRHTMPTRVMF